MNEYKAIIMTPDGQNEFEKIIYAKNIIECAKQLGKTYPKKCIVSIIFNQIAPLSFLH